MSNDIVRNGEVKKILAEIAAWAESKLDGFSTARMTFIFAVLTGIKWTEGGIEAILSFIPGGDMVWAFLTNTLGLPVEMLVMVAWGAVATKLVYRLRGWWRGSNDNA